jgi:phosphonate transport system substrate-binding protein
VATPTPLSTGVVTLGSVSLTPGQEYEILQPFAEALAARLGAVGIGVGRSVVVDSVGAMAEHLRAGDIDVYIDSPLPAAFVARRSGAVPLLTRSKQGVAEYHSVIFARKDSGVRTLDDLRGRVIAFGEPFSTASYFLPRATLQALGYRLERLDDPAAAVPADRIGYVVSGDAESSTVWVLKSKVAAAALNADYYGEMVGARSGEVEIVARTVDVPRNVVCVRRDLAPETVDAIERALLEMHNDERGRLALTRFRGTERFDRLPGGVRAFYVRLEPLLEALGGDLEGEPEPDP